MLAVQMPIHFGNVVGFQQTAFVSHLRDPFRCQQGVLLSRRDRILAKQPSLESIERSQPLRLLRLRDPSELFHCDENHNENLESWRAVNVFLVTYAICSKIV